MAIISLLNIKFKDAKIISNAFENLRVFLWKRAKYKRINEFLDSTEGCFCLADNMPIGKLIIAIPLIAISA